MFTHVNSLADVQTVATDEEQAARSSWAEGREKWPFDVQFRGLGMQCGRKGGNR